MNAHVAPNASLWVAPNVAMGGNLATRLQAPYWQRVAPYQPLGSYDLVDPKPTSTTLLAMGGAGLGPKIVSCEEGKTLLDTQSYRFLDLRTAKAYDYEHITKPARKSVNIPYIANADAFMAAVKNTLRGLSEPILVVDDAGQGEAVAAAELMSRAGYTQVVVVEGGYAAWREKYTTTGRNVPPKGRWISTGTEALKSGLNVGDVAASYEEKLNVDAPTSSEWTKDDWVHTRDRNSNQNPGHI
uniref:Rhodanese domain-containing protein n=1 Tax=Eutreptiella gymnastica TaxID=73025 RepID=A0A7S1NG67_9EUGL